MIGTAFARWQEPVAYDVLLHFDTETTGFAGGTGARAWMIGAEDWLTDGRLRLRQLTTTTMGAETAMLRIFAEWLLKTPYRLARLPNPLSGLGHLELLHLVRRHW